MGDMARPIADRGRRPTRVGGAWRRQLLNDLGGEEGLSAQERMILDLAVQTKLLLDAIDTWLRAQTMLIDVRRRALLPVVVQRDRKSVV